MKIYSAKVRNVKRIANPLRMLPLRYHICVAAVMTEIVALVAL